MSKWEPKEKRIDDIVNAAIEVFLDKGYEGASMEAIANKARISKGGLYHHFSSKEEILFYANTKLCEPISAFVQEAYTNPDAAEGLKGYIKNYVNYWLNHQKELTFFFLALTKALTCTGMWGIYSEYYNRTEQFLVDLFEKGIEDKKFIEHNARENSAALLAALDGILVYLVMNRELDKEEIIRSFEEKFIISLLLTVPKGQPDIIHQGR